MVFGSGACAYWEVLGLSLKYGTNEVVDMCMDAVITVISAIDIVPDMGNIVVGEVLVIAVGGGVNDFIVGACSEEYQRRCFFFGL